jgi:hypothetical protein
MIYVMVDEEGRVQRAQNIAFDDLPTGMSEIPVAGFDDVAVYMAYLGERAGGDPFCAVVGETGVFVSRTQQPTPPAERLADKRAMMLAALCEEIETSPVCRAFWEGADLEGIADANGWSAADIAAAERLMLRYALLVGDAPAPDWALASRYDA